MVHEEIDRLPEHYRAPLVLCDLEGCTHEQAARHLGWPVGTVKSRQARGRQRLRDRLIRRGLSPSSGMVLGAASHARAAGAGGLDESHGESRDDLGRGGLGPRRGPGQGGLEGHVPAKAQADRSVALDDRTGWPRAPVAWCGGQRRPCRGRVRRLQPRRWRGRRRPSRNAERTGKIYITVNRARPARHGCDRIRSADGPRPEDRSEDRHLRRLFDEATRLPGREVGGV